MSIKDIEDLRGELGITTEDMEVADGLFRIYILVQGLDWEEKPYWAYMAVPPTKVPEFNDQQAAGNNALMDFGDVILFGYGDTPPEEVMKEMEAQYGMQHNFAEDLKESLEKIDDKQKMKDKFIGGTKYKKSDKPEQGSGEDSE